MSRFGNCLVTQKTAWYVRSPAIVLPLILCSSLPLSWCVYVFACMYKFTCVSKHTRTGQRINNLCHSLSPNYFCQGLFVVATLRSRQATRAPDFWAPPVSALRFALAAPRLQTCTTVSRFICTVGSNPHSKLFSHGGISLAPLISPRRKHD